MFYENKDAQQSNPQPGSTQAVQFGSALLEKIYVTSISVCMDIPRMSVLIAAPLSSWLTLLRTCGYSLFVILIKLQSLSSITVKCHHPTQTANN